MSKMHENEIKVNKELVQTLLVHQCPQWAHLPLKPITSFATSHAIFRLGDEYVVRLPRIESAAASIHKEYTWVPQLASCLPISISEPCFQGKPDESYPWPWLVGKWHEGYNPVFEKETEYELLAQDLAGFLNQLHGIRLVGNEPMASRGTYVGYLELETRKAIQQLQDEVALAPAIALWEELLLVPSWPQEPVWVHGDLLPVNILVQNNRLGAVIDFADMGLGDPACDLIIAWGLLGPSSRKVLRDNLQGLDTAAWERSKGWALSIALIILPYYKNSNLGLVAIARRIIHNVLLDF
jgi:aminoglycoside phosphotransferase (APT) family kinase protein